MHDETFARLWREFCAHCLTPRDADVVPAPEGSPIEPSREKAGDAREAEEADVVNRELGTTRRAA